MVLTQEEAEKLLAMVKVLASQKDIKFPLPGEYLYLDAQSVDGRIKFIIDVNRKGRINVRKCTYQTRFQKTICLLRVDLDGPDHINPDGEIVPCPHIHIYREGYGSSWAYPLSLHIKTNPRDLATTLSDFLEYNNINTRPQIIYQFQGDEFT